MQNFLLQSLHVRLLVFFPSFARDENRRLEPELFDESDLDDPDLE